MIDSPGTDGADEEGEVENEGLSIDQQADLFLKGLAMKEQAGAKAAAEDAETSTGFAMETENRTLDRHGDKRNAEGEKLDEL